MFKPVHWITQRNTHLCKLERQQSEKANSEFQGDEAILEYNLCDFQGHQGPIRILSLRSSSTVLQVPRLLPMPQRGFAVVPYNPCGHSVHSYFTAPYWGKCNEIRSCKIPFHPPCKSWISDPICLVIWGQNIKKRKGKNTLEEPSTFFKSTSSQAVWNFQFYVNDQCLPSLPTHALPGTTGSWLTSPRWPFSPRCQLSFPPFIRLLPGKEPQSFPSGNVP